jgi:hypothetical protein
MVGIFAEVLNLQQKARSGALTARDFTNLDNRINTMLPGAPAGPGLRIASALAKDQQRLCEILCALGLDGGGSGGGAVPGGGGFAGGGGPGGGVAGGGGASGNPPGPASDGGPPGQPAEVLQPVPEAGGATVSYSGKVLLLNPAETGASVGYGLGHEEGQMLKTYQLSNDDGQYGEHLFGLPPSGWWVIQFDRGDGKIVTYALYEATYEFTVTEAGLWDLRKRTFDVTVDNTELGGPIPYLVDGDEATVVEGGKNVHSSAWPISILHDQGDGATARMRLRKNGKYQWRIQEQRLGLYRVVEAAPVRKER